MLHVCLKFFLEKFVFSSKKRGERSDLGQVSGSFSYPLLLVAGKQEGLAGASVRFVTIWVSQTIAF